MWAVLSFGNPAFKITLGDLVAQMNAPATSKYVELVRPGQPFTLYGESQLQGALNPSSGPPQTVTLHGNVGPVDADRWDAHYRRFKQYVELACA
jgi:hypothetical protein